MALHPDRLLRRATVARLLHVSGETLRLWHKSGFLQYDTKLPREPNYMVKTLDEFLARQARNFSEPLTTEDLLKGQITLVTIHEALKIYQGSEWSLRRAVASGKIATVRMADAHVEQRYCLESIRDYCAGRLTNRPDLLPRSIVEHILSVTPPTLRGLVASGKLVTQQATDNPHSWPITQESLLGLLKALLPDWIDPPDWLDERLSSDAPLMQVTTVLDMLQISRSGIEELVQKHQLLYINAQLSGRPRRLFLPESVMVMLEDDPPVSIEQIIRLYDLNQYTVREWRRHGLFVCPVASHSHPEGHVPTYTCWLGILRKGLSNGMDPRIWFEQRMASPVPLLSISQMAEALAIEREDVRRMVDRGLLRGIRTLGGNWYFTPRQLQKQRPTFNRQRRRFDRYN